MQQISDQQEREDNKQDEGRELPQKWGRLGGVLYAINRPWLLVAVLILLAGMWLTGHTNLITDNLNKPYALLVGPAFIGSVLTGWLIFKFFRTIEAWCKMAWRAFFRARREDGSAQFFWTVIVVFLVVSVFASGNFFTMLEHAVLPGLGYATALFIDLVAVQTMRARLNAVRMRDHRGASLYLLGVFVCAGASAFANVYTDLASFTQHATGVLPLWMVQVAPWFGVIFPALILLLSITADYTLDQTSTKLEPETYRKQEAKRIELIEIQRDMLKRRVEIEGEIDHLSAQLKTNEREFILLHLLFPKKPLDVKQIANQVSTHIRQEFGQQLQLLYTHIHREIGQAYTAATTHNVAVQESLKQLEFELNLLIDTWNSEQKVAQVPGERSAHSEVNTHTILAANRPRITRKLEPIGDIYSAPNTPSLGNQLEHGFVDLTHQTGTNSESVARTNRGPYHMTALEVANQYRCSIEQVRFAVQQGQIRLSGRTDRDREPIEDWKILISSLEGYIPPKLPKKRGRRTA